MSNNAGTISNEKQSDQPEVAVIILNWNNYEDTKSCIESSFKQSYSNHTIYIVDNGSQDGSGSRLAREYPDCEFIHNSSNLGFSAGVNKGIIAAKDKSDYILLMNNDCDFRYANCLQQAVDLAENRSDAGIVGGKIYYDRTKKIWSACGEIDWTRGRGIHYGHDELDTGRYDNIEQVGFVSGALMLISSDVVDDVGLLPEEYFFGAEEWDYSVQVNRSEYNLYRCPGFVVDHEVGASHKTFDQRFIYNTYRNKLLFQRRNLPKYYWAIWYLIFRVYSLTLLRRKLKQRIKQSDESADVSEVMNAVNTAIKDDNPTSPSVKKEDVEQFGSLR
ncbi:glycosyltransferase family 2 protein [Halosegnis rubeus]|uniref:glycosyltransferase family 2 protein n=1 Tax=Halosegnis rubeus TaxID=2212850 RepID=UPI001561F13B|nr:glycosyltransferase family 2 protein [Halosegnis rubeus]